MSSAEPRLSVVIATRNRADLLAKALAGLTDQSVARDTFEVIVVDNGSTDNTQATVHEFAGTALGVRSVFEHRLGLNIARNTGWRAARGPLVAFLDDDAIPVHDWVERILSAFAQTAPAPSCVGGPVEPIYETSPPPWLHGPLLDFLTVVEHAPGPTFLTDIVHRQKLAGANMAFRKADVERVGGFHPWLDRVGDNLLSGGDVLIQLQFERLGLPVFYDPTIRVRHHVSAKRLTRTWLEDRAYWGGVSDALLAYLNRPTTLWWALRTLAWNTRMLLFSPRLLLQLLRSGDEPEAVTVTWRAWHRLGGVVGGLRAISLALGRT